MRNVCTEAGMSAIRAERDYVIHEDFMKVTFSFYSSLYSLHCNRTLQRDSLFFSLAFIIFFDVQAVRKLNEAKKLESSAHYSADFGKD